MWPIEFRSNNLSDTVCSQNYQKRSNNLNSITISMNFKHEIWFFFFKVGMLGIQSDGKTESDKFLKTKR